jgi:hypothetical protein
VRQTLTEFPRDPALLRRLAQSLLNRVHRSTTGVTFVGLDLAKVASTFGTAHIVAAMSHKCRHADVSTGGTGAQASPSSSARRQSTHRVYLKRKDLDDSVLEESKSQPTPTTVDDAESDARSNLTGRTRKKAEPVKSACIQCQKRKTKCSGERPVCRFCSDRNLECSWDVGDGLTRTANLKRKLLEANRIADDLGELVGAMRSGTDQTSSMLLAKLRLGDSLESLLSNIRLDESPGESGQFALDLQMVER